MLRVPIPTLSSDALGPHFHVGASRFRTFMSYLSPAMPPLTNCENPVTLIILTFLLLVWRSCGLFGRVITAFR